jgi:hypothetical protein
MEGVITSALRLEDEQLASLSWTDDFAIGQNELAVLPAGSVGKPHPPG